MKNNKNAKHADHFQQCVVKDVCGLSLSFFTCSHQESKALCSAPGPRRPWSECICWTDCRPGRRLQQNSITHHSTAHRLWAHSCKRMRVCVSDLWSICCSLVRSSAQTQTALWNVFGTLCLADTRGLSAPWENKTQTRYRRSCCKSNASESTAKCLGKLPH